MTNQKHPITPPPELVDQWYDEWLDADALIHLDQAIAVQAARWGADQQLAKDAKWLDYHALNTAHLRIIPVGESLKEAMRPKPPILKELALDELTSAERLYPADWSTIRRAIEALPE
jgi:hypothetical protein